MGAQSRPNTKIDVDALLGAIKNDPYRPTDPAFKLAVLEIAANMQLNRAMGENWKILESAELPTDGQGFACIESDELRQLTEFYVDMFNARFTGDRAYYDPKLAIDASARRAAEALVAIQGYVDGLFPSAPEKVAIASQRAGQGQVPNP